MQDWFALRRQFALYDGWTSWSLEMTKQAFAIGSSRAVNALPGLQFIEQVGQGNRSNALRHVEGVLTRMHNE